MTKCQNCAKLPMQCNRCRRDNPAPSLTDRALAAGFTVSDIVAKADRQGRVCYGPDPEAVRRNLAAEALLGLRGVVVG